MIEELPDRWLVRPRHVVVGVADASAGGVLMVHLETDLHLQIFGQWTLARSVARVVPPDAGVDPAEMVGSQQASFVLFDSGSVRLVLLNGMMLRASTQRTRQIRCYRPGDFSWQSEGGHVERSRVA